jgi:predicted permease
MTIVIIYLVGLVLTMVWFGYNDAKDVMAKAFLWPLFWSIIFLFFVAEAPYQFGNWLRKRGQNATK